MSQDLKETIKAIHPNTNDGLNFKLYILGLAGILLENKLRQHREERNRTRRTYCGPRWLSSIRGSLLLRPLLMGSPDDADTDLILGFARLCENLLPRAGRYRDEAS
jgi:hypothetical protein